MAKYFKVENNTITEAITAEADFISNLSGTWVLKQDGFGIGDTYEDGSFSKPPIPSMTEEQAREWRDSELKATDFIVPTTDYPNHAQWLTYREQLRDWPSTDDFPETKPTKP
jgi:hypothetical protein